MESVDPLDKHLDPPDGEYTAECEICGERHDIGDMKRVGDKWADIWVCDFVGSDDCFAAWSAKQEEA